MTEPVPDDNSEDEQEAVTWWWPVSGARCPLCDAHLDLVRDEVREAKHKGFPLVRCPHCLGLLSQFRLGPYELDRDDPTEYVCLSRSSMP